MLTRIIVAIVLTVVLQLVPLQGWPRLVAYLAVYLIIGGDILMRAVRGVLNREVTDENFLMAVATVGAFALAIYERSGDYLEAIAVMLFYQIGEFFQSYAVGRSRRNIAELMDIRPDTANIERDGHIVRVDPDEVAVGDTIVVQPGERIPIDGIVTEGTSTLDTAALTGESLPRDVAVGTEVVSGCVNLTGMLKVQTTREFGESTASRVLDMVEDASSHKSRSEAFISRFARVYTPAVCLAALALAVLPPVVRMLALGIEPQWSVWLYRALIFLVISCPCALVISIPLSFFAGIGGASRAGILVKGSDVLEVLSRVKTVVLDKTGTLTQGTFELNDIHNPDDTTLRDKTLWQQLVEKAALVEGASSHPISKSLQRAYGHDLDMSRVTDLHEISGHGITARVDGVDVAVGNDKLMSSVGVTSVPCHTPGTIVHIAVGGKYAGHIVLGDVVKPVAQQAIEALRAAGVERTVMLTGDTQAVADQVATQVGIDEVHAQLLPGDKVAAVESLIAERGDKKATQAGAVAAVGDGINDAPVLARADVGIAMGAMGSDAAIEAADVVLMDDDPRKIAQAIKHGRHTLRIVWQNIIFAIGVKVICLILGALGIANMWLAIFADVGVMVIAVLNALRALRAPSA